MATRTTLTVDDDVMQMLDDIMAREKKSMKHAVNDAIRAGLAPSHVAETASRYVVEPHAGRLRPGLDPGALNRLADDLESGSMLESLLDSRQGSAE